MSKQKILIVNNEPGQILDLKLRLRKFGYENVSGAESLIECTELMKSNKFDIVLISINLGEDANGVDAAQKIREKGDLHIIYLMTLNDQPYLNRAKKTNPLGFILKPFEDLQIQMVMETAIAKIDMDRLLRINEETLRRSEEKFQNYIKYAVDWEYFIGKTGALLYVTPSCEKITGYTPEEFLGDKNLLKKIIHPDDIEIGGRTIEEDFRPGDSHSLHLKILTKNNEVKWIDHRCESVYGKDEQWLGRRVSNRDISSHKSEQETNLKISVDSGIQSQQLLDRNPVPTMIWKYLNEDFELKDLNEAALKFHNVSRDKVTDIKASEFYPAGSEILRLMKTSFERRTTYTVNLNYVSNFAKQRGNARLTLSVIPDDLLLIFAEDFSRQSALEEMALFYRTISDNAAEGIIITNLEGKILKSNKYSSQLTGLSAEELQGLNIKDVDDFYKNEPLLIFLPEMKQKGFSKHELKVKKADGSAFQLEVTSKYFTSGTREFVIFILREFSGKQTEPESVPEDTSLLSAFFNAAVNVSLITTDTDAKITEFNPGAEKLFGYTKAEVINQHLSIFNLPGDADYFISALSEMKTSNEGITSELLLKKKSGDKFSALYSIYPVTDSKGALISFLGVAVDISDKKRAETEIQRFDDELMQKQELLEQNSNEMAVLKSRLAENEIRIRELALVQDKLYQLLKRDLKDPMEALTANLQLISSDFENLSVSEVRSMLQSLNTSAKDLMLASDGLSEWTRIQTSKPEFLQETVILSDLTDQTLKILNTQIETKNLTVHNNIEKGLLVFADKNMVITILKNLLSNSIKYSNPGNEIRVSAQKVKNYIQVTVADSGIGLNEENLGKLFRIESHFSTPGTMGERGSGIGLSICKELISRNGGKIWVESEVNKGSSFKFTLPSGI